MAAGGWRLATRIFRTGLFRHRALILSANAIDGRFALTTDAFAFFDVSLAYSAQTVSAEVTRNGLTFADVAALQNDKHTAMAVQALGSGNAIYDAALQLRKSDVVSAFDGLSGDIHASARSVVIDTSRYLRDAVTGRLRQSFGDPAFPATNLTDQHIQGDAGLAVWGQGFGSFGHTDGSNVPALDTSTGGFFLGADRSWGDWRVGFAGGYSQTSLDPNRSAASLTSDNYHLAAYGGTRWGGLSLGLGGAHTWHRMDAKRSIAFPGFSDALRSDKSAGSTQFFADLGYNLTSGRSKAEPFVSLAYVNGRFDGFGEDGGAAALRGLGGSANTVFSTLGVRAATTIDLTDQSALTASMTLGWRHASGDLAPRAGLMFQNGVLPFSVTGTPIARDAIVLEAGIGLLIARNATMNMRYSSQLASNSTDQGFKADLKWKF